MGRRREEEDEKMDHYVQSGTHTPCGVACLLHEATPSERRRCLLRQLWPRTFPCGPHEALRRRGLSALIASVSTSLSTAVVPNYVWSEISFCSTRLLARPSAIFINPSQKGCIPLHLALRRRHFVAGFIRNLVFFDCGWALSAQAQGPFVTLEQNGRLLSL